MPSRGSLLKKKRTKDSDSDAKKEPQQPPNKFAAAGGHAPSSPPSATKSPVDGGAIDRVLSKNSAFSKEPDAIAGDGDTVAPTSQASTPSSGTMNKDNKPTIDNMLNQPNDSQHDSAYSSGSNQTNDVPNLGTPSKHFNPQRETKGKYTLTDFNFQRTLGTGSFGRVHLAQSKHNQRYYAVKVLKKQQVVKMKQVEHTNDERKMLQRCRHPFLITLWGTWQDSKNLYMVMDFIEGGELFSLLRKSQVRCGGRRGGPLQSLSDRNELTCL